MRCQFKYILFVAFLLVHQAVMSQWALNNKDQLIHQSDNSLVNYDWVDAICLIDIDSASLILKKFENLSVKDTSQVLLIQYFKARLLFLKGLYNESISVATSSIRQWEYDSIHRLNNLYNLMSDVFMEKGYPDKAFEYSLRNSKKNEKAVMLKERSQSFIQLGKGYIMNEEYQKGLSFLDSAFQYFEQRQQQAPYHLFISQAKARIQQDELQMAQDRINKALFIARKNQWPIAQGQGLLLQSELEILQGQFSKALENLQLAAQLFEKAHYKKGKADVNLQLSLYHFYNADFNRAIQFAQKSVEQLEEFGAMHPLLEAHRQLYIYHAAMNDFKNALTHYRFATTIKDSIFSLDKIHETVETEIKYKSKILEREKAELERKNNNQKLELQLKEKELNIKDLNRSRLILVVSILGVLTLLMVLFYSFRTRNRVLTEKIRANDLEQRALRAQMNPHFMFNSLNSIQSLIASGKNSDASIYLAKFSRLMRQILNNSREAFITLQAEIDFLNNYVVLEQRRFKESFDFSVEVDPSLDAIYVMIPPMILQPFIENAILHGLLRLEKKGQLKVQFMDHDKQFIKCIVDDNGIGREAAKTFNNSDDRKSLGLKITAQRLLILSQKIKHKFELINIIDKLDVNNVASGTKVEIYIPKRYQL